MYCDVCKSKIEVKCLYTDELWHKNVYKLQNNARQEPSIILKSIIYFEFLTKIYIIRFLKKFVKGKWKTWDSL